MIIERKAHYLVMAVFFYEASHDDGNSWNFHFAKTIDQSYQRVSQKQCIEQSYFSRGL
jgi:hypothetical protein